MDIEWPTEKTLGRYTISPDNVANKALPGGPFTLKVLYHDGRQVNKQMHKKFSDLLKKD